MLLYVHTPIRFTSLNSPDVSEEDLDEQLDEFNELKTTLDSYGMYYLLNNRRDGLFLTIYPQKMALDDVDMNTLFTIINMYFYEPTLIKYSPQGGIGCEFGISLIQG
jgi:hypothetical protein